MAPPAISFYNSIERVISIPRLEAYRASHGTENEILCRYLWNISLCESLYPAFQMLEVSFRNAVHSEIATAAKVPEWLMQSASFLYRDELSAIEDAKASLAKRKGTITEPVLIAEMGFGFWTSLLDSRYETMWHRIIAGVFPYMPRSRRTRQEAARGMNMVRKMRNAALHHHSLWHWADLVEQHKMMHTLIEWICPSVSQLAKGIDRFGSVYSGGPKQFDSIVGALSNRNSPVGLGL